MQNEATRLQQSSIDTSLFPLLLIYSSNCDVLHRPHIFTNPPPPLTLSSLSFIAPSIPGHMERMGWGIIILFMHLLEYGNAASRNPLFVCARCTFIMTLKTTLGNCV